MVDVILSRLPARIRLRIRDHFLRGHTVHCPVCGRGGIAFLPAGVVPRPHASCMFCGSRERTRMIWWYLDKTGALRPGVRLLHVAPELSLADRFRKVPGITYVAGDKMEPGYTYAPDTVHLDITDMSFPDASFDMLICSHVLEHVPDDRTAMRELHRVLKPGGMGIILVPIDRTAARTIEDPSVTSPEERLRLFGQKDHVRFYGRDYVDRLSEAGFKVTTIDPSDELDQKAFFKLGFARGEELHVVTK